MPFELIEIIRAQSVNESLKLDKLQRICAIDEPGYYIAIIATQQTLQRNVAEHVFRHEKLFIASFACLLVRHYTIRYNHKARIRFSL